MVKVLFTARSAPTARLTALALTHTISVLFALQAAWRGVTGRANALGIALAVYAMTAIGSAFAQGMSSGGNSNPDDILNKAVCGTGGWLTWFTSTKFLVVLLVAGLIGFFLGRAMGKRDNDGIVGTLIAVLGLGAIRILVKIVTAC
ncbi:hypothetical protein DESA109040_07520 [Deinococcus saxicola]|uniref:hypothetical protein n=1 Tax=Deinococcus saxicola TaxID=249406 RepID=UPI0039F00E3C